MWTSLRPSSRALVRGALVVFSLLAIVPSPAAAQSDTPAAPAPEPWYSFVTVNGFLSASYSYNFNQPDSRTNTYRVFDFDDRTFKLDVAELVVQRNPSKRGEAGFRVDFTAGSSLPRVLAAAGLFRDESGKASDFDLQQAYVSWIAPVGRGLRLDAGKFMTHFCYELADGYDGFNDNATRSFLFGYSAPATHTGLRVGYGFNEKVAATLLLVNGWDNARDNNAAKSIGGQLALTPSPAFTVYLNGMWGPEQADNTHDARTLVDLVAMWKATGRVNIAFEANRGTESGAALGGGDAVWTSLAGYLRLNLGAHAALAFRVERFDDRDGARTGLEQRLASVTLTPEYRIGDHIVVRSDLRLDSSNRDSFEKRDLGWTDRQATVFLNAIYVF